MDQAITIAVVFLILIAIPVVPLLLFLKQPAEIVEREMAAFARRERVVNLVICGVGCGLAVVLIANGSKSSLVALGVAAILLLILYIADLARRPSAQTKQPALLWALAISLAAIVYLLIH
jgi:hypothetical protein